MKEVVFPLSIFKGNFYWSMKYPHAVYRETVKYFSLIIIATKHSDMVSLRIRIVTSSSLNICYIFRYVGYISARETFVISVLP